MSLIPKIRALSYPFRVWLEAMKIKIRFGIDVGKGTRVSSHAIFDKVNPKGIHIGQDTKITGAIILAHDDCTGELLDTYIGDCCFIGTQCIIYPGVRIGNGCVVGSASVVVEDVPDHCMVVGNPAHVIRENIKVKRFGHLL